MFIYCITNLINGKKYVGQTKKTIQQRFSRHCWKSEVNKNMPITLAIAKYGKDNFRVEKLLQCTTQEELDAAEIRFALELNTFSPNGYNLKAGNGPGSMSETTRLKISKKSRGRKASDETRAKLSASHLGIRLSEEAKQKLSAFFKGKKPSQLCRDNSRKALQKEYTFVDPNGMKVTFIGLKKFCKEHGLLENKMCELGKGRRKNYKGWTV